MLNWTRSSMVGCTPHTRREFVTGVVGFLLHSRGANALLPSFQHDHIPTRPNVLYLIKHMPPVYCSSCCNVRGECTYRPWINAWGESGFLNDVWMPTFPTSRTTRYTTTRRTERPPLLNYLSRYLCGALRLGSTLKLLFAFWAAEQRGTASPTPALPVMHAGVDRKRKLSSLDGTSPPIGYTAV